MDPSQKRRVSGAETRPPSLRTVEAVAERMGVDPVSLDKPLYDAVDPDALDALFDGSSRCHGELSFRYYDYRVTVSHDGDIVVD